MPGSPAVSAFAPLRRETFRARWLASIVSNTGGWMQDTAATWLMATLSTSPLWVALMQTAASLPVLVLGLPAGALADIWDRRRLLLFWQSWMLATAVLLSLVTFAGGMQPVTLIALTLLLNVGAAMNNPAWQAIVPELVPREELPQAIALNSAGFNLGRALGPALGGLVAAAFVSATLGAGAVFLVNAASFVFVVAVLYRWKRAPTTKDDLPAERTLGSIRAGVRYMLHAATVRGILLRAVLLTSGASALWALLAVVAQRELTRGASGYGFLNGCIGAGAVLGAVVLPRIRRRLSPDALVAASSVVFAGALLVMALLPRIAFLVPALMLAGVAWTGAASTFNVAVQNAVPSWVKARALGSYQMVFQGGLALGSALWGWIAQHAGLKPALCAAAVTLLAGLPLARRFRLTSGPANELSSALSSARAAGLIRAAPAMIIDPNPEEGPVLITVSYRVDDAHAARFVRAMHQLKEIRLRDGAVRWGIFRDPVDPESYQETFVVESWAEYLRQRDRMTLGDLAVRNHAQSFHRGPLPPSIARMIYASVKEDDHQG